MEELYTLLKNHFEGGSSGIVTKPSGGSTKVVFVNRDSNGCWYTLDADNSKNYITEPYGIRGEVADVEKVFVESAEYDDTYKLVVTMKTAQGTYKIRAGFASAFGKSLLASLAGYTVTDYKDLFIGAKPSAEIKGKGAKVCFAEVCKGDGTWSKSLQGYNPDELYRMVLANLGKPLPPGDAVEEEPPF